MVIKQLSWNRHSQMWDVPEVTKWHLDSCSQLSSPAQRSSYWWHVLVHRGGSCEGHIETAFD